MIYKVFEKDKELLPARIVRETVVLVVDRNKADSILYEGIKEQFADFNVRSTKSPEAESVPEGRGEYHA